MKTYKGFQIDTKNGSSFIYKDGELKGCTHTDYDPAVGPKNNSATKAMNRIDNGKISMYEKN